MRHPFDGRGKTEPLKHDLPAFGVGGLMSKIG